MDDIQPPHFQYGGNQGQNRYDNKTISKRANLISQVIR